MGWDLGAGWILATGSWLEMTTCRCNKHATTPSMAVFTNWPTQPELRQGVKANVAINYSLSWAARSCCSPLVTPKSPQQQKNNNKMHQSTQTRTGRIRYALDGKTESLYQTNAERLNLFFFFFPNQNLFEVTHKRCENKGTADALGQFYI